MKKIVLNDEQIAFLIECFETTQFQSTKVIPQLFAAKYPDKKCTYPTLKTIYNREKKKNRQAKRVLSNLSDIVNQKESKLLKSISMLSIDEPCDEIRSVEYFNHEESLIISNHKLIIYSELFKNFLNTFCNGDNLLINYDFKFEEFIEHFNLKVVDVPGDGLCFVSSVRLFLLEFKFKNITIDDIVGLCNNFFMMNRIDVTLPEEISYQSFLISELYEYFELKKYDSSFVDYIVNYSYLLFSLSFVIVEPLQNSVRIHLIKQINQDIARELEFGNVIVLYRQKISESCYHFSLLVPSIHQMSCVFNLQELIKLPHNASEVNVNISK